MNHLEADMLKGLLLVVLIWFSRHVGTRKRDHTTYKRTHLLRYPRHFFYIRSVRSVSMIVCGVEFGFNSLDHAMLWSRNRELNPAAPSSVEPC